jgi:hypothetical protein
MSDGSREAGMIRFVKMAIFLEFNSSFSYVRRLPPEDSIVKVRTIRFVSIRGGNPKSQARNPKQYRSTKYQCPKRLGF